MLIFQRVLLGKRDFDQQNVARTIGFTTFAKRISSGCSGKVGRPTPLQPQMFFFAKVVKPMVLATIFWSKSRFPYKTNGKSTF